MPLLDPTRVSAGTGNEICIGHRPSEHRNIHRPPRKRSASLGGWGGCVKSVLYRTLSVRDLYFIFAYIGLYLYFICTRSVLYRRVHRTKSVLYRRVHRAYIGLNPYYIAAYIRTISDFLAFLKPLSNCNTNALCPNHAQIWSLTCIQGCASPMSVVEENTLQVTPSRAVHVV